MRYRPRRRVRRSFGRRRMKLRRRVRPLRVGFRM